MGRGRDDPRPGRLADDQQGAAAQVKSGGRLVATGVSFLNLHTTVEGGAVRVDRGGTLTCTAKFRSCLFGQPVHEWRLGIRHGPPRQPWSRRRPLLFLRCNGRHHQLHAAPVQQPLWLRRWRAMRLFQQRRSGTKVTIMRTRTVFANNQHGGGDGIGGDIEVWRDIGSGNPPCPAPGGKACSGSGCCFDGLTTKTSLTVTLTWPEHVAGPMHRLHQALVPVPTAAASHNSAHDFYTVGVSTAVR